MSGFVTERDLREAEAAFPGIERLYLSLRRKPSTFLDLVRLYLDYLDRPEVTQRLTVSVLRPSLAA